MTSSTETYRRRRAQGLCGWCDNPPTAGKATCEEHRQRVNAAVRQWRERNPERARATDQRYRDANRDDVNARKRERYHAGYYRWRGYGLAPAEYATLLFDHQLYCCAVCWKPFTRESPPHVDHDHALEAAGMPIRLCVRGLLHQGCNNRVERVENGVWTGGRWPSDVAYHRDHYRDLLEIGRYLARPKPFAD